MASEENATLVTCDSCDHTWEYAGVKWQVPCPNCETPTATGLSGVDDDGEPESDRGDGERGVLTVETGGETFTAEVAVSLVTDADGFAVESARLLGDDHSLEGRQRRAALAEYLRNGGRATLALEAGPEVFEVRPRFSWTADAEGVPRADGLSLSVLDWELD